MKCALIIGQIQADTFIHKELKNILKHFFFSNFLYVFICVYVFIIIYDIYIVYVYCIMYCAHILYYI